MTNFANECLTYTGERSGAEEPPPDGFRQPSLFSSIVKYVGMNAKRNIKNVDYRGGLPAPFLITYYNGKQETR